MPACVLPAATLVSPSATGGAKKTLTMSCGNLLTTLPARREVLTRYVGLFSNEEMIRDFKEQGFRLEKTRIKDKERLSRLVLCVCIASLIALLMGDAVEAQGKRPHVERASKQQMSLFQFGLRYSKRLLVQGHEWTELIDLRF